MYKVLVATRVPLVGTTLLSLLKEMIGKDVELILASSMNEIETKLSITKIQMLVVDLSIVNPISNVESEYLIRYTKNVNTLILYETITPQALKRFYKNGILAVLDIRSAVVEFRMSLYRVYSGECYIEAKALINLLADENEKPGQYFTKLTSREKVIGQMLMEGKTNKEIGRVLEIQPSTVSTFKKHIYHKLNITSLMELSRYKWIILEKNRV